MAQQCWAPQLEEQVSTSTQQDAWVLTGECGPGRRPVSSLQPSTVCTSEGPELRIPIEGWQN